MKIVTNKRLLISESRDDSNRCTPCKGKPDQYATYASHTSPCMHGVRFLWAVPVHGNLSWVINRVGQSHCSREKGLPTQSTTRRLTDPRVRTQFVSRANQWSSGESHTSINNRLLGLPGPYHWHVIGTFNTCSWGPTERSLIDTGGGYNLECSPISTREYSRVAGFWRVSNDLLWFFGRCHTRTHTWLFLVLFLSTRNSSSNLSTSCWFPDE
jgi:hypothetical protein